jgi:hypothetical protein
MSGTLKYKMSERYSVGWTDPRGLATTAHAGIKFGDYYIVDSKMDVLHFYHNGFSHVAKKEEFAVFVEAFLKEKKSEQCKSTSGVCSPADRTEG